MKDFYTLKKNEFGTGDNFNSILHNTVHIYSAIAVNTTNLRYYDNVVLSGWELRTSSTNNYTCCLIYEEEEQHVYATDIIQKQDWSYLGKAKLEVKQFVCPNLASEDMKVPVGVTLSKSHYCPKNTSIYVKVDRPIKNTGDQMAVCGKIVYGDISAVSMIEWFEYQKYMGVNKVLLYTYNLNDDAKKVLNYYVVTGLAEFHPYSLPMRG